MRLDKLMTPDPACCTPETPVQEVARLMVEHDCGEIPIVQSEGERRLVGVVTDRDIVVRLVAVGRNPAEASARDCMTQPAVTISADASLSDASELMQSHQIRRLPIVDGSGQLVGIVAQADIARAATAEQVGDTVREISQPDV